MDIQSFLPALQAVLAPASNAVLWLFVSLVLVVVAIRIYTAITPYDDFRLIGDGNSAVAYALSGTLVGLVIPLFAVIIHTGKISDLVIWSTIALLMQLVLLVAEAVTFPGLRRKMAEGKCDAAGIWLGAMSASGGALVAACNIP